MSEIISYRRLFLYLAVNYNLLVMRITAIILFILPFTLSAQTSRVTVASGDFYNPLIWNPVGLPTNGDMLQINHAVVININIYYTAGQIKINSGGSLIQDATPRTIWIDGGSFINEGTHTTHLIYVSNGGYLTNSGSMTGIDSMMVSAEFTNNGTAGINDFWVMPTGAVTNIGTLTNTDSMFVQGAFTNSGSAAVYDLAFDQMATLTNTGTLDVTHNMHNQGMIFNTMYIDVANDFSNCNTQSLNAVFSNNGTVCFGNDFLNCDTDTIKGSANGKYYVGGLSSNLGVFSGMHTFYTPNGSLTLNTGFISPSVTLTTGTCYLASVELDQEMDIYPNPTNGILKLSVYHKDIRVVDISGNIVKSAQSSSTGEIDLSELKRGVYFISIDGYRPQRVIKL